MSLSLWAYNCSFKSKNLGLVLREQQYWTAISNCTVLSDKDISVFNPDRGMSFGLTSPTLLRHPARCLSLLLWCTPSHTETRPAQGCVAVFCPCWRRVFDPRLSPLMGWSWFLQHGRRPLMVCWWSSLNTCRTSMRRNHENVRCVEIHRQTPCGKEQKPRLN